MIMLLSVAHASMPTLGVHASLKNMNVNINMIIKINLKMTKETDTVTDLGKKIRFGHGMLIIKEIFVAVSVVLRHHCPKISCVCIRRC
jgi:hypothetical protein